MAKIYNDILKVRIGRVKASASVNNYFPVTGETITIDAETKWGQSSEWQIQDGSGNTTTVAGNLVHNKDSRQILIASGGELQQKFIGRNNLAEASVIKKIYAMLPQELPYFNLCASKEIIRADGISTQIRVSPENGYSGNYEIVVRVYKENEMVTPFASFTNSIQGEGYKYVDFFTLVSADRGIYDVEVDCIDSITGKMLTKRVDKLITITPKLCPKPADTTQGYDTITVMAEKQYEIHLWRDVDGSGLNYAEWTAPHGSTDSADYKLIDISVLPAGTTLCIKRDNNEVYPMRMRIKGNIPSGVSSENGTPNFTYEKPLVITHDENDIFDWKWMSFGAITFGDNMRNIVLDGYGYNNTGIKFTPSSDDASINTCIFVSGGASDIEIFGIDIDKTGFAGIMAKADPEANSPWFWRGNWMLDNLRIHHCTIQNTAGEGVYLGYYGSGKLKGTNKQGQEVEYYAHLLDHLRLYRVDFINTGLDSFQVNNAINVDICYVNTTGSGASKQGGQNYASSSVFDGRMYNCRFLRCNGPIAFCGPLLDEVHIYNNVMEAARYSGAFVSTLWKSSQDEHIDLNGDGVVDEIGMYIYNNVIKAYSLGSFNTDYTLAKYFMDDNIIITEIGVDKLPTMFTGGEGNVFIKASTDYEYIDQLLKVADSANDNYQPNYNSSLVTSGKAGRAKYDIRGYKNWYGSKFRTGPYLGIYKDTSIADTELQLTGISINNGATGVTSRNVSVKFNYMGTPTRYRIAESADLTSVAWIDWTGNTVDFTISDGNGEKIVYAQIATSDFESEIKSASINYTNVIQFSDAEVKRICVSKWGTNGEITSSEAAAVTEIPDDTSYFRGNTLITSFDELVYFTGLTSIANNAFYGCTALTSISLPESLKTIGQQSFRNCTSLANIKFPSQMDEIKIHAFWGCMALKKLRLPDGIITANCGYQSGVEEVYIPDSVETISHFTECIRLRKVDIGTGVKSLLQNAFNSDLAIEIFIIRADVVPSYAGWTLPDAFAGTIYVPDESVSSYKVANGWIKWAALIKPLSEYTDGA